MKGINSKGCSAIVGTFTSAAVTVVFLSIMTTGYDPDILVAAVEIASHSLR